MQSAVIVQIMIVSMKTESIAHIPCVWCLSALEFALIITEEPRPASFENTPRFTPHFIASSITIPTVPPPTALNEKASVKMRANTEGTFSMFIIITAKQPSR